jgi:hypothetical protein
MQDDLSQIGPGPVLFGVETLPVSCLQGEEL